MYVKEYNSEEYYTFHMYFKANNDDEWWTIAQKTVVNDDTTESLDAGKVYEYDGSAFVLDSDSEKIPVYNTYGACCVSEDSEVTYVLHDACCLDATDYDADTATCTDATKFMTDTTAGEKNFRVLFQMGDDDSDWQGVRLLITESATTSTNKFELDTISFTDTAKTSYPCSTIL